MLLREIIKMGKNAQGRKVLDIHIFKLLKIEKKCKGEINVTESICISRNEGFRLYEIPSALKDIL